MRVRVFLSEEIFSLSQLKKFFKMVIINKDYGKRTNRKSG